MIQKARDHHLIKGLGLPIDNGHPIINLHYADDTIIFCEADDSMMQMIKWIFIGFEAISGMKINFHKSDLYALNLAEDKATRLADIFGCQVAHFPIIYLGIPIHWKKLCNADWHIVLDKFQHKLAGWQGNFLSYGGKITLIKSVLSSLVIYMMSMYSMPKGVLRKIDQIRAQFLWNNCGKKRYHLINWKTVCRSHENGGLEIKNLQIMNTVLLAKWYWKFRNDKITGWWKTMIQQKYGVFGMQRTKSHFWTKIIDNRAIIDINCSYEVHNGCHVQFWQDSWHDGVALKIAYYSLYRICTDSDITVNRALESNLTKLKFRRQLTSFQRLELDHLKKALENYMPLSPARDKLIWTQTKDGSFSTKLLYNWVEFGGLKRCKPLIWSLKIPIKIQMFLWLLSKRRILTRDNLVLRGWEGNPTCAFCHNLETVDHLMFGCHHSVQIWNWFYKRLNVVTIPEKLEDLLTCATHLDKHLPYVYWCSAILWVIWKHRNDCIFNDSRSQNIQTILADVKHQVQYWSLSWKRTLKEEVWSLWPEEETIPLQMIEEGMTNAALMPVPVEVEIPLN